MCKIIECTRAQLARVVVFHYEQHNNDYDYFYMSDCNGNEYKFGYHCAEGLAKAKYVFCNLDPDQIRGFRR
jgi:hypothetical protein